MTWEIVSPLLHGQTIVQMLIRQLAASHWSQHRVAINQFGSPKGLGVCKETCAINPRHPDNSCCSRRKYGLKKTTPSGIGSQNIVCSMTALCQHGTRYPILWGRLQAHATQQQLQQQRQQQQRSSYNNYNYNRNHNDNDDDADYDDNDDHNSGSNNKNNGMH